MQSDWFIHILSDLREFAQLNGCVRLVEQLEMTQLIAAAELATLETEASDGELQNISRLGRIGPTGRA